MNGSSALNGAIITTAEDFKLIHMYINGTNSNSYDVYCNSSDTCKIDCLSTDACTNMNLYCYGTCKVACDSRGTNCPISASGGYVEWYTDPPTNNPTRIPTIEPGSPSLSPSQNPSEATSDPTSIPTSEPNNDPTVEPPTSTRYNGTSVSQSTSTSTSTSTSISASTTVVVNTVNTNVPENTGISSSTVSSTSATTTKAATTRTTTEIDTTSDGGGGEDTSTTAGSGSASQSNSTSLFGTEMGIVAVIAGVCIIVSAFVCLMFFYLRQRSKSKKVEADEMQRQLSSDDATAKQTGQTGIGMATLDNENTLGIPPSKIITSGGMETNSMGAVEIAKYRSKNMEDSYDLSMEDIFHDLYDHDHDADSPRVRPDNTEVGVGMTLEHGNDSDSDHHEDLYASNHVEGFNYNATNDGGAAEPAFSGIGNGDAGGGDFDVTKGSVLLGMKSKGQSQSESEAHVRDSVKQPEGFNYNNTGTNTTAGFSDSGNSGSSSPAVGNVDNVNTDFGTIQNPSSNSSSKHKALSSESFGDNDKEKNNGTIVYVTKGNNENINGNYNNNNNRKSQKRKNKAIPTSEEILSKMNEMSFEYWNQKQVIVWLKHNLLKNEIDKKIVLGFLKEVATKNVTGKQLKLFKENNKFMDGFIAQFSQKNQAYSIWVAIKSAVNELGLSTRGLSNQL